MSYGYAIVHKDDATHIALSVVSPNPYYTSFNGTYHNLVLAGENDPVVAYIVHHEGQKHGYLWNKRQHAEATTSLEFFKMCVLEYSNGEKLRDKPWKLSALKLGDPV